MKNFLIRMVVNAFALYVAALLIPGMDLAGDLGGILVVVLVFGVLNAVLKPILLFFSLPVLVITLGLFALVVNALVLWITAGLTDALYLAGFWAAFFGALVVSLVTLVLGGVLRDAGD